MNKPYPGAREYSTGKAASPAMRRQVGGAHYLASAIQPIDIIKAWLSPSAVRGALILPILKYLVRYRSKNGIEDLRKAQHYLELLIEYEQEIAAAEIVNNNADTCRCEEGGVL